MKVKDPVVTNTLRLPLLVFLACMLIAVYFIGVSYYLKLQATGQYRQHKNALHGATKNYMELIEQEQWLENHYKDFLAKIDMSMFEEEDRLNWVESLQQAGKTLDLPGLHYEIGSKVAFDPDIRYDLGPRVKLYASEMKLDLELLHEEDLVRLFNYLDSHARGLYDVMSCDLELLVPEINPNLIRANIRARCLLHWLSFGMEDTS